MPLDREFKGEKWRKATKLSGAGNDCIWLNEDGSGVADINKSRKVLNVPTNGLLANLRKFFNRSSH